VSHLALLIRLLRQPQLSTLLLLLLFKFTAADYIFDLNVHYSDQSFLFSLSVYCEGAIRLHDRKQHAKQWEEERNQLRSFMTMDYRHWHRRTPKHN
jgi:hypothetical protein